MKALKRTLYIACSVTPNSNLMVFESGRLAKCYDEGEYYTNVIGEVDYRRSNEI